MHLLAPGMAGHRRVEVGHHKAVLDLHMMELDLHKVEADWDHMSRLGRVYGSLERRSCCYCRSRCCYSCRCCHNCSSGTPNCEQAGWLVSKSPGDHYCNIFAILHD